MLTIRGRIIHTHPQLFLGVVLTGKTETRGYHSLFLLFSCPVIMTKVQLKRGRGMVFRGFAVALSWLKEGQSMAEASNTQWTTTQQGFGIILQQ